jgi:hypothetical protein
MCTWTQNPQRAKPGPVPLGCDGERHGNSVSPNTQELPWEEGSRPGPVPSPLSPQLKLRAQSRAGCARNLLGRSGSQIKWERDPSEKSDRHWKAAQLQQANWTTFLGGDNQEPEPEHLADGLSARAG